MLLLLTLHALAAFQTGAMQLRIAGNLQDRHAADAAANDAIGKTLDAGAFSADPASVAAAPIVVDIDGDGTPDFVVSIVASCTASQPLAASSIDADADTDFGCVSGAAFGATSLCVMTQWDLQATTTVPGASAQTGARMEVHQGASVRMSSSDARSSC